MKLELLRISSGTDATVGVLFDVSTPIRRCLCYTLEDQYQEKKVPGETRIPEGLYIIKLRTEGGYHQKYTKRYGSMHKGMLCLQDVRGFTHIYLHTGNTHKHTKGCILVGYSSVLNTSEPGTVGLSTSAYTDIYPPIADAILEGKDVSIKIMDASRQLEVV